MLLAALCKGHSPLSRAVLYVPEVKPQCSPIGSTSETEFAAAAVTTPSVYLNTEYPALCNGTVRRWEFCFYRPATHGVNDSYRLTLAVYRRIESGNSTLYEIVGPSMRTIGRRFSTESSNFSCQALYLNNNTPNRQQFNTEAGDIIGVCVYEPRGDNREPMDVISEANGYSLDLLQNNDVGIPCGAGSMPSIISSNQLSTVNSRLLHLSAIVRGMLMVEIIISCTI